MISNDFSINFKKKQIYHNLKGSKKIYSVENLYTYLQDVFDEPENMKYQIPIRALSKTSFALINGWQINKETLEFLKGNLIFLT